MAVLTGSLSAGPPGRRPWATKMSSMAPQGLVGLGAHRLVGEASAGADDRPRDLPMNRMSSGVSKRCSRTAGRTTFFVGAVRPTCRVRASSSPGGLPAPGCATVPGSRRRTGDHLPPARCRAGTTSASWRRRHSRRWGMSRLPDSLAAMHTLPPHHDGSPFSPTRPRRPAARCARCCTSDSARAW